MAEIFGGDDAGNHVLIGITGRHRGSRSTSQSQIRRRLRPVNTSRILGLLATATHTDDR